MKKLFWTVLALAVIAAPILVVAQETMSHPPKVLQIYREEIKAGQRAAHEAFETNFVKAQQQANYPYHTLAITSTTGKQDAWFISSFDSFSQWAKANDTMEKNHVLRATFQKLDNEDATYIGGASGLVATYVPDLSYRPDFNIGNMRAVTVTTFRIKPGYADDWKAIRKQVIAAHEKTNADEHFVVYEVRYGAPATTYLLFQMYPTIAAMDEGDNIHGAAYQAALGDEFHKRQMEFARNGLMYVESNMYTISGKMSYMPPEVVAASPEFWHPKSEPMTARKVTPTKAEAKASMPKKP